MMKFLRVFLACLMLPASQAQRSLKPGSSSRRRRCWASRVALAKRGEADRPTPAWRMRAATPG